MHVLLDIAYTPYRYVDNAGPSEAALRAYYDDNERRRSW